MVYSDQLLSHLLCFSYILISLFLPLEKQRTSALLCLCRPASAGVDASSCEAVKRGDWERDPWS